MILSDLPYGTSDCAWDSPIPLQPLWEQYLRIIKPHGAIVLTATQPFASMLVSSQPSLFRHEWIWNKSRAANFANCKNGPMKKHESVLVFSVGRVNYYPIMEDGDEYKERRQVRKDGGVYYKHEELESGSEWTGGKRDKRYPSSVRYIPSGRQQDLLHPTQKPVELFEYLIRTYTLAGETVLDTCMGSGTTAIACMNTNRQWVGFESDAKCYSTACERILKLEGGD
jgi:site-specific DNA-methyltransferase (adenine-specific)